MNRHMKGFTSILHLFSVLLKKYMNLIFKTFSLWSTMQVFICPQNGGSEVTSICQTIEAESSWTSWFHNFAQFDSCTWTSIFPFPHDLISSCFHNHPSGRIASGFSRSPDWRFDSGLTTWSASFRPPLRGQISGQAGSSPQHPQQPPGSRGWRQGRKSE